ncbi:MAG: hypothetical protein H6Q55_870 [Deltaproteobacteria bacterium]|nr:hypothetical protein [Deltaproteobacteria bacterium]
MFLFFHPGSPHLLSPHNAWDDRCAAGFPRILVQPDVRRPCLSSIQVFVGRGPQQ